jgi:hypothetical protein
MNICIETWSLPVADSVGELLVHRISSLEKFPNQYVKGCFKAGLKKVVFTYSDRYVIYYLESLK